MKLNAERQNRGARLSAERLPRLMLIAAVVTSGCGTQRGAQTLLLQDDGQSRQAVACAQQTFAHLFPPRYRAAQRAIITVGRKQFTCDGVLTAAPGEGHHLAVISSLGLVTDLRVRDDGACELLKTTPLFPATWSRDYVARDLDCLFVPPAMLKPAGRLADGRLVLQTVADSDGMQARYIFAANGERWQELELIRNGRRFSHASIRRYRAFPGIPREVPCEFEVTAASHRLELRIVELSVPSAPKTEAQP
jgi:hypothetical protein